MLSMQVGSQGEAARINQEAQARMGKFYLFGAQGKRLAAAEEALDRLERLPDGPCPDAARMVRAMAASLPEEQRLDSYKRALERTGQESAVAAAQPALFLARVGLAVLGEQDAPALAAESLRRIAEATDDPLSQVLARHATGVAGLRVLSERPEADGLARGVAGKWLGALPQAVRYEAERTVAADLARSAMPHAPLLAALAALPNASGEAIETGFLRLAGRHSPDVLAEPFLKCAPEGTRKLIQAQLDAPRGALAARVLGAASQEQGDRLLINLLKDQEAIGTRPDAELDLRLRVAASLPEPEPALAGTLWAAIAEELPPDDPAGKRWMDLAARLKLDPGRTLQGGLHVLRDREPLEMVAARVCSGDAGTSRQLFALLAAEADGPRKITLEAGLALLDKQTDVGERDWLVGLATAEVGNLQEALTALHEPLGAGGDGARAGLAALAPLASSDDQRGRLAWLADCPPGRLRDGGMKLDQNPIELGNSLVEGTYDASEQVEIGRALQPLLGADWSNLAGGLASQASEPRDEALVWRGVLRQASQGRPADLASRLELAEGMLCERSQLPDSVGDRLFALLREGGDATLQARLDEWLQYARNCKFSGHELARGAVGLAREPRLSPVACALDSAITRENADAGEALLKQAATLAAARGAAREEAFLRGLLSLAETASSEQAWRQSIAAAMEVMRTPVPGNLQEAAQACARVVPEHTPEALGAITAALAGFAATPDEQANLELLRRLAGRTVYDTESVGYGWATYLDGLGSTESNGVLSGWGRQLAQCSRNSLDNHAAQRDLLELLTQQAHREKRTNLEQGLAVLAGADDRVEGVDYQTRQQELSQGLEFLTDSGDLAPLELLRSARWQDGNFYRAVAAATAAVLASQKGSLAAQAGYLGVLAGLPVASRDQAWQQLSQAAQVMDAGRSASEAVLAMGRAALENTPNGLEGQQLAALAFEQVAAHTSGARAAAAALQARLARIPLGNDDDRNRLARTLIYGAAEDPAGGLDSSARAIEEVLSSIADSSLVQLGPAFILAVGEETTRWGDLKILPPRLEQARNDLRGAENPEQARDVLAGLCRDLAASCGASYFEAAASQKAQAVIEERSDAILVGGVRVAKKEGTEG